MKKKTFVWWTVLTTIITLIIAYSEYQLHINDTDLNKQILELNKRSFISEKIIPYYSTTKTAYVNEKFLVEAIFGYVGNNPSWYYVDWDYHNEKGEKKYITLEDEGPNSVRFGFITQNSEDKKTVSQYFRFTKEGKYQIIANVYYNTNVPDSTEKERIQFLKDNINSTGDKKTKIQTITIDVDVTNNSTKTK